MLVGVGKVELIKGHIDIKEIKKFRQHKLWLYKHNPNPSTCASRARHWTLQAYECYITKKDCNHCNIKTLYGIDDCVMYKTVGELLIKHGEPSEIWSRILYGKR